MGLDQLCCLDRLAKNSCLLGHAEGHLHQGCSWSGMMRSAEKSSQRQNFQHDKKAALTSRIFILSFTGHLVPEIVAAGGRLIRQDDEWRSTSATAHDREQSVEMY